MEMTKILCIIPARAGSKGILNKNIREFCGKPLLAWTIEHALASKYSMRVIVSTDSEEYATIARNFGAETPFLRPAEISQDLSIDEELMKHALQWLEENEGYRPEIIVQLRTCYPTRSVSILDSCIEKFLDVRSKGYTSLRTIVPAKFIPFKMYRLLQDLSGQEFAEPLFRTFDNIHEPFNNCRQVFPKVYVHNPYVDIALPEIIKSGSMSGSKIYPFTTSIDTFFDIDTPEDWEKAEKHHLETN